MKKIILCVAILYSGLTFSQDGGYFFGGFESNSQWLLNDEGLNFIAPEDQFRANNYFRLDYNLGEFTAGVQYETYLPAALLGYAPIYDNNNGIGTYYLNFKHKALDITAGYFYEQFGNGLILRSWEDRQLGINNAIKGIRVICSPLDYLNLTGVYGKTRNGFNVSEGVTQGIDANLYISEALKMAGIGGKMEIVNFSFDLEKKYTFWSGITGGFFLALSYFGTDQSQVQRYLSGKSVKESQLGLMFNAVLKIPMQFFILLTGIMVFVFFEFNSTPVNFNPQVTNYLEQVQNEDYLIEKEKFISLRNKKRNLQIGGHVPTTQSPPQQCCCFFTIY